MTGEFKSFSSATNKMTLGHDGDGIPDTAHDIDPTAKVTLNGKPSKFAKLKPGDKVELTGEPVTVVKATR